MTKLPIAPLFRTEPLGVHDARYLAEVLSVIAEPTRLRIISLIASAPEGERPVAHIKDRIGLSNGTINHHLKILVNAGLLSIRKKRSFHYYSLVEEELAHLADLLRPPRHEGS